MSGQHVLNYVTDYIDDTLAQQQKERVKSHLLFCNPCRDAYKDFTTFIDMLGKTPRVDAPEDFVPELWKKVDEDKSEVDFAHEIPVQKTVSQKAEPMSGSMTPAPNNAKAPWVFLAALAVPIIAVVLYFQFRSDSPKVTPVAADIKESAPVVPAATPTPTPIVKPTPVAAKSAVPAPPINIAKPVETPIPAKNAAPFESLSGNNTSLSTPTEKIVSSQKEWASLWEKHSKDQPDKQPLPEVDFETKQVLVIVPGEQPSSGFSIKINQIESTAWNGTPARVVYYRVQTPPKDGMVSMVLTKPFLFRVVSRKEGLTYFRKSP